MKSIIQKSIYIIIFATILNIALFGVAHAAIDANELVNIVNTSRSQNNIAPLNINSKLQQAATAKAQDMFTNQYFAHTSPASKTPWDFISAAGYDYNFAGENLAIGYDNNQELHSAWMNSVTHRENILSPNFTEIGIAEIQGTYQSQKTIIVVQMFGSPNPNSQTIAGAQNNNISTPSSANISSSNNSIDNLNSNTKIYIIIGASLMLVGIFMYNLNRDLKSRTKSANIM